MTNIVKKTNNAMDMEEPKLPELLGNVEEYKYSLKVTPEIQSLVDQIDIENPKSIWSFGEAELNIIVTISDDILAYLSSLNSQEIATIGKYLMESKSIESKDSKLVQPVLEKYKLMLEKCSVDLKALQESCVIFYQRIVKHIVAGEIDISDMVHCINSFDSDELIDTDCKNNLNREPQTSEEILEKRVFDLKTAERTMLELCLLIYKMEITNFRLLKRINI